MSQRRFNEAEVAAIFREASEAQQAHHRQLPSGEGATLAELREIGREVGISSDLIDQAALVIDQAGTSTSRSFLGFTVGVGRIINLDRNLSDDEWERFVVVVAHADVPARAGNAQCLDSARGCTSNLLLRDR